MALTDYHATAGDWRAQLKSNERKTKRVIALFLLTYLAVGFLVDMFIAHAMYPTVSLTQIAHAFIGLKLVPYATLAMLVLAAVSLLVTYSLYDRIMLLGTEYKEITEQSAQSLEEQQVYHVVEEMKVAAGLHYMPKVFIINADYMNAFASGYSERSAMVAITRGLMEKLDRAELQAVMAHELSHIRHHDIKLTLTVTVLSNIMLIVIDMLFYSLLSERDNDKDNNRFFMVVMVLRYVLPLITMFLALFLSRTREYMADAGCVELMRDNSPMARALLKISQDHAEHVQQYTQDYGNTAHEQVRHASYLFDPSDIDPIKSFNNAFSTHPTIEQRLAAIGFVRKS